MKTHAWIVPCLLTASIALAQTPELAEPMPPEAPPVEAADDAVEPGDPVGTTLVAPSAPVEVTAPMVATPGVVCCPIEIVDTRTKLSARHAYRCYGPPVETVVCVENPADCKLYSVPFCVPGCCLGEPQVCNSHVGLLGRGYADVVWPNGFTATVVFRVHGGAILIYAG